MTAWSEPRGRAVVYARSGGLCEACGFRRAESWSHRVAKSRGGLWEPSNGLHLCGDGVRLCHGWLENHPLWATWGGWHVRRDSRRPCDVPVYLLGTPGGPGWYLLDDEGARTPTDLDLTGPAGFHLPAVPPHLPWHSGRPLATTPWMDPR